MLMLFFYRFVLGFALFFTRLLGFAFKPARIFVAERRLALERWEQKNLAPGSWWFHVSSVGELEQVRPVVESLRKKNPQRPVLLSYFSSSVPRLVKDWSFVSHADFLPIDNYRSMERLFAALKPRALVLNRYDLWPEMLERASIAKVPVVLINASTPPLGFWGLLSVWFRRFLFRRISYWTYVDTAAATAWEPFAESHTKGLVTGNSRVDRALERVEQKRTQAQSVLMQKMQNLASGHPVIVAGSTWSEDEVLLLAALQILRQTPALAGTVLFLVPHEPTLEHVTTLIAQIQAAGFRYVLADQIQLALPNYDIVIVNVRGILAELYALGQSAYVGGGFGKQVHSVIEPLAHGLPVSLGPRHKRMPEVQTLIALEAAYVAQHPRKSAENLAQWFADGLQDGARSRKAKSALALFMRIHHGAGERIADFLEQELGG